MNLKQRQAEHLKMMLTEQGMTQEQFAHYFEFSTVSVSHWCNGKTPISNKKAEKISAEWSDYSPEWIKGHVEFKNQDEEINYAISKSWEDKKARDLLLHSLVRLGGLEIETPDYEPNAEKLSQAMQRYIFLRGATLKKDGKVYNLSQEEEKLLLEKVTDYFLFELEHLNNE